MSKLLICAVNQPGDLRYKQGDIVTVYPDTYTFQAGEGLPNFWQVTVLNIVGADRDSFIEEVRNDPFFPRLMTRRRKRFVDITQWSNQAQNSIAANGTATVLRVTLLASLTLRV
jgi:hypothetical protein